MNDASAAGHDFPVPSPFPPASEPDEAWVAWANAFEPARRLNLECLELSSGRATFIVKADPFIPNPNGAVSGAIVAAIADLALGIGLARILDEGHTPRTGSLQVQYHRPVRLPVTVTVTILPGGRRIQFLEAVLTDAAGQRCASAQATMTSVGPPLAAGRQV
ncbi:hypothetical protein A5742_14660 [Mycolicibacterium fortuitum]|uniref:Thioesterase domain-containing protein n=1 Tax=Mycolicibacterium fortuitum TaxID=1766 RepID=A0ABD6QD67_MYCFO|nr:PaaI family thioesterase [Mycolicibacterium fortuitum]OMC33132.1 hypothetical protein A5742_14660 [Mycolicibacterium fortuitum]